MCLASTVEAVRGATAGDAAGAGEVNENLIDGALIVSCELQEAEDVPRSHKEEVCRGPPRIVAEPCLCESTM